jgi:hypothetical protein
MSDGGAAMSRMRELPRGRQVLFIGLALLTQSLAGCTPWPEMATGGAAERHPTASVEVINLEHRYAALRQRGADRRAAARMVEVSLLLARARREYVAELALDLQSTLLVAEAVLASIERDMRNRAHSQHGH